ncbi:MAG: thiamine pyrophosphate-binding protein, partial [Chloroflexi bacterium]|nr:thiamine pyrophosphate-binding protein [Chloroflexota bacterium]
MNNVELFVNMLERAGVRWVFGVPSGPVLPLIEALRLSDKVEFVLTASETSAGFMAEAVGRMSGVPGVCVSTVGPGATNLTTGVGGAFLDRSPVIAITCNYVRAQYGRRTQMFIDHQALFAPLTKASYLIEEGHVAETLARALGEAMSEPPGPVHLDFPEDVGLLEATESPRDAEGPVPASPPPSDLAQQVEAVLRTAERPLVVAGLTLTRAMSPEALLRFIDKQQVPFVTTLHAKGFLPES